MNGSGARVAAAVACIVLAGCTASGADRVGAASAGTVTELTILDSTGESTEVGDFSAEVSNLSHGTLRIRYITRALTGVDYDAATIRAVQDGQVDLGAAGTRAMDAIGAPGIAALGAPFLIDSYPLQERVLADPIITTALEELRPSGLVGIGIMPGPIRRPFGLAHPLATPADFAGQVIGTQQSAVADETLRALGARPVRLPRDVTAPSGLAGLDGVEMQISSIEGGRLDEPGSHLMTNVDLWPRPLVVFARAATYDRLSTDQQTILKTAAADTVSAGSATEAASEAESAANLCRKGNVSFDDASAAQLGELRNAVEPVYVGLERDAQARAIIQAVEQVKQQLAAPPTRLQACPTQPQAPPTVAPGVVDGVWTMDTVKTDADPQYDENWGHWVFVLDRGKFAITQENATSCTWGYGTYAINGNRMTWTFVDGGGIAPNNATNRPGEMFAYDVSAYRDTLALSAVPGATSPSNFMVHPWHRVSSTASRDSFSQRCPPPQAALTG